MKKKQADQEIKIKRVVWFSRKYIPLHNKLELGKINWDIFLQRLKILFDELAKWDKEKGYE